MGAHRSGATLEQNAKVPLKCKFYYVFLRVTFTVDRYLQQLMLPGSATGSRSESRALLPTPPGPLQLALFGEFCVLTGWARFPWKSVIYYINGPRNLFIQIDMTLNFIFRQGLPKKCLYISLEISPRVGALRAPTLGGL